MMLKVKSKIWLERDKALVFGEGKLRILEAVDRLGSLNKAAESLGMSFRHAWGYIKAAEQRLGLCLLQRAKGGRNKGGSRLTTEAKQLIEKYKELNQEITAYTDLKFKEIFRGGIF